MGTEAFPNTSSPASRRRSPLHRALVGLACVSALQATPSIGATPVACRITVYANDRDPNGLNLRDGPGVAHRVVAVVKDDDAQFDVVGADGPWLRIAMARRVDGGSLFRGDAWVFGALTAVRATRRLALRVAPDARSAVAGPMATDAPGRVDGCRDQWVRVRSAGVDGWMPPGLHCGNPVTGCV